MKELIPILTETWEDEGQINTVNARELHEFLEVKSRFNDWIQNRIKEYKFQENQDYISFTKNLVKPDKSNIVFANSGVNSTGGRPTTEYHLSLDMAKELSMVEKNVKGKEARRYFIECERKLLHEVQLPSITQRGLVDLIKLHAKGSAYAGLVLQKIFKQTKPLTALYAEEPVFTPFVSPIMTWWKLLDRDEYEISVVKFLSLLKRRMDWPNDGPKNTAELIIKLKELKPELERKGVILKKVSGFKGVSYIFKNKPSEKPVFRLGNKPDEFGPGGLNDLNQPARSYFRTDKPEDNKKERV